MDAMTVAVDLAKNTFEVVMANREWRIIERHRFSRARFQGWLRTVPRARVVMEACATAHHWGRLAHAEGHAVVLLPAAYVRPYVRRNKTDRTDAEALLEALRSGQLPPVPVKRVEHQALVALHRVRAQWQATRTARINALRGLLAEQGLVLPITTTAALAAAPTVLADAAVPVYLRHVLLGLHEEIRALEARIKTVETQLRAVAGADPVIQRLRTIPGVGLLTATALARERGQHPRVSSGASICELAGPDPLGTLERRAALAGRHYQTRGSLSALPTHARGAGRARHGAAAPP